MIQQIGQSENVKAVEASSKECLTSVSDGDPSLLFRSFQSGRGSTSVLFSYTPHGSCAHRNSSIFFSIGWGIEVFFIDSKNGLIPGII